MRSSKKQNSDVQHSLRPQLQWLFVAVLVMMVAFIYRNAFSIPFHFVEVDGIQNNIVVKSPSMFIEKMLTLKGLAQRPLSVLSYTLNYAVGGEDVFGYHLVNWLIHVLNILLVFVIARRWVRLPMLATAIFALHPLASACASQLFGRPYSLAAFFMLIALERLSRPRAPNQNFFTVKEIAIQSALFVLMLLSKQSFVFFPVLVAWHEWKLRHFKLASMLTRNTWKAWALAACTLALIAAFCLSYASSLKEPAHIGPLDWALSQLGNAVWLPAFYILPFQLSFLHYLPYYDSMAHPDVLIGIALVGFAAWVTWRYRTSHGWLLGAMLITLLPTNSFFPKNEVIREWRLYPSLAFFALWAAELSAPIFVVKTRRYLAYTATAASAIYLLSFAVTIERQNEHYQTPVGLWLSVLNSYPNFADAANNAGHFLLLADHNPKEALKYFLIAQRIDPTIAIYAENTGRAYAALNEFEKAEAERKKAKAIFERYGVHTFASGPDK